ncbi:MAG: hypothetical protein IT546_15690 [Caulobacteraceae bacterium]|nr:hypothetical protein [Caulobacteraceae bacterium]
MVKECRKTAAVIGPVKGYTTRGRDLTKGDLRACNTGAAELAKAGEATAAAQKTQILPCEAGQGDHAVVEGA